MKRRIEIQYEWWDAGENKHPDHDHQDDLTDAAEERIYSQMKEGYMSGELNATIEDEGKEYSYRGWWEVDTVVLNDGE